MCCSGVSIRKSVTPKLMKDYPIHLRAYDLLADEDADLRELPYSERRKRLETLIAQLNDPRIDLSPHVSFVSWDDLGETEIGLADWHELIAPIVFGPDAEGTRN